MSLGFRAFDLHYTCCAGLFCTCIVKGKGSWPEVSAVRRKEGQQVRRLQSTWHQHPLTESIAWYFCIKDVLEKSFLVHLSPSVRVWYDSLAQEADCKDALRCRRATPILQVPVGSLCLALGSLTVQRCPCACSSSLTSLFIQVSFQEVTSVGLCQGGLLGLRSRWKTFVCCFSPALFAEIWRVVKMPISVVSNILQASCTNLSVK